MPSYDFGDLVLFEVSSDYFLGISPLKNGLLMSLISCFFFLKKYGVHQARTEFDKSILVSKSLNAFHFLMRRYSLCKL